MSGPERARIIAGALARTAERHRRTALIAALIALGACILAAIAGRPAAKGVAIGLAALFFVFGYRALRSSTRCLHPEGSPVLQAIAKQPADIARIAHRPERGVVVTHKDGTELCIHVEGEAAPLLDALAEHAPEAAIER